MATDDVVIVVVIVDVNLAVVGFDTNIIIIIIIITSARSFTMQLWETQISQQWHCDDEPFGYSSTGEWVYSTQFRVPWVPWV